jgi:hypothetical protein
MSLEGSALWRSTRELTCRARIRCMKRQQKAELYACQIFLAPQTIGGKLKLERFARLTGGPPKPTRSFLDLMKRTIGYR